MAAPLAPLRRCFQRCVLFRVASRTGSSSSSASPSLYARFMRFLSQRFYDVEMFLGWRLQMRRKGIQKKNAYYGYTKHLHGEHVATAYYILCLKGGFRYAGQPEWYLTYKKGRFNWDFMKHKDAPLEEVNMNYTLINYTGLQNLEGQHLLRTLSLRGCSEVDDWFLARLHVFQDSLEELDISHCPKITIGGLPALINLTRLRRLDVSSLQGLKSPGLAIILLKEMLPQCQIIANGYDLTLRQETEEENKEPKQGQRWSKTQE
ncbi:distal membrane-arm assembly complex protein 2 [Brachionichthys hirsutus]|uniref:distal membrane-arm assembly complex protein 2 n=1 Tax=Brachionichthys hirsutus TaxID=412623 RepID=UPI00360485A4